MSQPRHARRTLALAYMSDIAVRLGHLGKRLIIILMGSDTLGLVKFVLHSFLAMFRCHVDPHREESEGQKDEERATEGVETEQYTSQDAMTITGNGQARTSQEAERVQREADSMKRKAGRERREAEYIRREAESIKREAERAMEEAVRTKREAESALREAARMKQEAEQWKQEAEHDKQQAARAAEEAKSRRKEAEVEKQEAERMKRYAQRDADRFFQKEKLTNDEIAKKTKEVKEAQSQLSRQVEQTNALREQLQVAQQRDEAFMKERSNMQNLLETRRAELQDAHSFLVSANTISENDVVQMVRNLNAEIFQAAQLIAETFHSEYGEKIDEATAEHVRTLVGPLMERLLQSRNHQDDPILVQMALHAVITHFAAEVISKWDLLRENSTLSQVHEQILKSENQTVAGRWRALTRRYLEQSMYHGGNIAMNLANELARRLSIILKAAHTRIGPEQVRETALQNFEIIIRMALDLRRMIGEEIVGSDYQVIVCLPGDMFDPEQMEDAYKADIAKNSTAAVLCASELGLRRIEKTMGSGRQEFQRRTLVKPKAVVETVLHELDIGEGSDLHRVARTWSV